MLLEEKDQKMSADATKATAKLGTSGSKDQFLRETPPMGIYETLYKFKDTWGDYMGNGELRTEDGED
jgi:hypothetical protein